jgi:hypothetical protein
MIDTATLQARLTEAQTALHDLIMGKSVVKVGHGDLEVTYRKTDEIKLRAYISELNSQLGNSTRSRPLRPVFR